MSLVMFALSAAFDTIDHDILLRRIQLSHGFNGAVLQWFRSYLADRSQFVRFGSAISATVDISCSVHPRADSDLVELIGRHSHMHMQMLGPINVYINET